MISEYYAKKYCNGDISQIENYNIAINDTVNSWQCHHRLETHDINGIEKQVYTPKSELIKNGLYYNRPPEELIFLSSFDHNILHNKKRSEEILKKISIGNKGKIITEETRKKLSISNKGKKRTLETRKKMSLSFKGRKYSDETRQKMRMAKINKKICKPVKCLELNLIFPSIRDAERFFEVSSGSIKYAIKNNGRCCKCHWEVIKK